MRVGNGKTSIDWLILLSFLAASLLANAFLVPTKVLLRHELQSIDQRFEQRPWFQWSKEGLRRLNPMLLWEYHQKHEQPCDIGHWDYTLSWLLEPNVAQAALPIVIFNRLPEDEPPPEAVKEASWMKPLLQYPVSRKTIADWIHLLRQAGARAVLIDQDFSSPSDQDAILARELVNAHTGKDAVASVPVFFVRNLVKRSGRRLGVIESLTEPNSLVEALRVELGRPVDLDAYTGISVLVPDEDQVARRCLLHFSDSRGAEHLSVFLMTAKAIADGGIFAGLKQIPEVLDIDFIAPPNSSAFPVRPLTYLCDPERRKELLGKENSREDISVKGAVVLIGDGLDDLFNTPLTHQGLEQMSGTEVVAQALNTIVKGKALIRTDDQFNGLNSLWLSFLISLLGSMCWLLWRTVGRSLPVRVPGWKAVFDLAFVALMLLGLQVASCVSFAQAGILFPTIAPAIALTAGALLATIAERDRERKSAFESQLDLSEQKLIAQEAQHKHELSRQAADAEALRISQDQHRRREFVMRINHDLNAPVTVLNWALADMESLNEGSSEMKDNVDVLLRTSDRLCMLLDEMSRIYEDEGASVAVVLDMRQAIMDSVKLLAPLARARHGKIDCELPEEPVYVKGTQTSLVRVFDNLIRNALRHNPQGTIVRVSMSGKSDLASIRVSDNGGGIPEEKRSLIFQDSGASLTDQRGHGLGLGIVKSLINELGGEISLDQEYIGGCCFDITLPRVSEKLPLPEHNENNPSEKME